MKTFEILIRAINRNQSNYYTMREWSESNVRLLANAIVKRDFHYNDEIDIQITEL